MQSGWSAVALVIINILQTDCLVLCVSFNKKKKKKKKKKKIKKMNVSFLNRKLLNAEVILKFL